MYPSVQQIITNYRLIFHLKLSIIHRNGLTHTGFWIEKIEIYLKLVNFPCSLEMYKAVTWNSNSANQISEIWAQWCNTHAPREKQQLWASKKGKNKGVFIKHYDKDQTISQKKVQMHFTTNQLFVEIPVQSQLNYFNLVINDW